MLVTIIIILGILSTVLFVVLSEEAVGVHAARSAANIDGALQPKDAPKSRFVPWAKVIRDENGRLIKLENKMLAVARGSSCERVGVRDGATVVAEKFSDNNVPELSDGDVVIIDSITKFDAKPLRFRIVKSDTERGVEFYPDDSGDLNTKPRTDVVARVLYSR